MKHFVAFVIVIGLLLVAQAVLAESDPAPVVQTDETLTPTSEPPFGAPGKPSEDTFRRYYQIRCYPGCHEVQKDRPSNEMSQSPWGAPGKPSDDTFRRYYQIRCYPGCHETQKGPQPTRVHP
jgi:hypothetical protein